MYTLFLTDIQYPETADYTNLQLLTFLCDRCGKNTYTWTTGYKNITENDYPDRCPHCANLAEHKINTYSIDPQEALAKHFTNNISYNQFLQNLNEGDSINALHYLRQALEAENKTTLAPENE